MGVTCGGAGELVGGVHVFMCRGCACQLEGAAAVMKDRGGAGGGAAGQQGTCPEARAATAETARQPPGPTSARGGARAHLHKHAAEHKDAGVQPAAGGGRVLLLLDADECKGGRHHHRQRRAQDERAWRRWGGGGAFGKASPGRRARGRGVGLAHANSGAPRRAWHDLRFHFLTHKCKMPATHRSAARPGGDGAHRTRQTASCPAGRRPARRSGRQACGPWGGPASGATRRRPGSRRGGRLGSCPCRPPR